MAYSKFFVFAHNKYTVEQLKDVVLVKTLL